MEKKWYALYVHSRQEKKVSGLLRSQDIEEYLPLQKVVRQWSDRKKTIEEPLFKSYVFCRIPENDMEKVRRVSGVTNFVYWLGKPAVIRDNEILEIKDLLDNYDTILVENIGYHVNDEITIAKGPFANQKGMIKTVEKNKIKIFIESLGCLLIADITKNNILNLHV